MTPGSHYFNHHRTEDCREQYLLQKLGWDDPIPGETKNQWWELNNMFVYEGSVAFHQNIKPVDPEV